MTGKAPAQGVPEEGLPVTSVFSNDQDFGNLQRKPFPEANDKARKQPETSEESASQVQVAREITECSQCLPVTVSVLFSPPPGIRDSHFEKTEPGNTVRSEGEREWIKLDEDRNNPKELSFRHDEQKARAEQVVAEAVEVAEHEEYTEGNQGDPENDLHHLFQGLDTDKHKGGLVASAGGWEGTMSLLKSDDVAILPKLAASLLSAAEKHTKQPVDSTDKVINLLSSETGVDIIRKAWKATEEEVVQALAKRLVNLRSEEDIALTARDFNAKFADNTFEAQYKGMADFLSGVEGSLGLPGKNIAKGMKMEFCNSEDSEATFETSNYGAVQTTPVQEYNFVVKPDLSQELAHGRVATPLEVLLYATSARKANSDDEAYDTALEDISENTRNGVKAVLLRRVKEVGMTKSSLMAGAEKDHRLAKLAASTLARLKFFRKEMGAMLRKAERDPLTGQPRFDELQVAMEKLCGLDSEELDALLAWTREGLKEAGLLEEEVLALRLYTGPAYVKLNGTLRERDVGGKGNKYKSAIFAVVSGMGKLAEISPIPEGRVVYRGQSGMRLPESFWKGNAQGVKGGVELAFLSTTTDMEVAIGYVADGTLPMVFAIQTGAVDKGAAVGFLSQYPDEDEILMPPRSFLETVEMPSVLLTARGPILSVPVKINCNLQCPRLEKLRDRRKTKLVSTLEHVLKEVARDMNEALQTKEVIQRYEKDEVSELFFRRGFVETITEEPATMLEAAKKVSASWYNDDHNFRLAMQEAMAVQRLAMGKLELWMQDASLNCRKMMSMNSRDCERATAGRLRRMMEDVTDKTALGDTATWIAQRSEKQAVAAQLCKLLGLIHNEVDEPPPSFPPIDTTDGETWLMKYSVEGNVGSVGLLLKAGADANAVLRDGKTALMLAAMGGLTDVVVSLTAGGASPNVQERQGWTALMYAASNGHSETVSNLLKCRADARLERRDSMTAFLDAANGGHLRVLQVLHQKRAADVNAAAYQGWTALIIAARNGNADVVRWLVKTIRADVDRKDREGKTALMWAAQMGHGRVVKLFNEARTGGSEVHTVSSDSETKTLVMLAAQNGHEEVVKRLVGTGGAVLKAVNDDGATILMLAAQNGHEGLVKWLLETGEADVNTANRVGETALMSAAQRGHAEVVKLLVETGKAEVNAVETNGFTALQLAAQNRHDGVVKWLLEPGGANVNAALNDTKMVCMFPAGKRQW